MAESQRPMDEARFAQGLTYADYIAGVENNREELEARYREVELTPDDVDFFNALARVKGPLKVIALVEDWCPDVVNNLPVLARIAQATVDFELRVFPRDQNLDIMDRYLNQGQFRSIPTFVFFDSHFNELGRWVERPAAATQLLAQIAEEQAEVHVPDDLARRERRQRMARAYRERLTRETIREIREVLA